MTEEVPASGSNPEELGRRIRRLELGLAAVALAWIGTLAWAILRPSPDHDVLRAERLEIVEPDGQPAFVLANSRRPAVGTFHGEVLMEGQGTERRMPNFIFFDGHGDEVGGMLFGNRESEDGFSATRHFSLDGYKQDQTVQLFHRQSPEGASAGLRISDRPEGSLRETFEETLGLEIPFTREEADSAVAAAVADLPGAERAERLRELFGVRRVFLGSSRGDEAALILRDGEQRPRIVLGVPEEGEPYIRVLDGEGEVVAELPE